MNKATILEAELRKNYSRLGIAFSGGTDSTLLAEAAKRALGAENVLLLHADSVLLAGGERRTAVKYAVKSGLRMKVANIAPLNYPEIRNNGEERCYHCKKLFFTELKALAKKEGFPIFADGSIIDDMDDYRPGMRASNELGVVHPLLDCGFSKADVREISREYKLFNADEPASACLATRIPVGTPIENETLRKIETGERFLTERGFPGCRVRVMADGMAKLELLPEQLEKAIRQREDLVAGLQSVGFKTVVLDMEGYRRGAMNKTLFFR